MSNGMISVTIAVCTWRRTSLAFTLRSLNQLSVAPEWQVSVLIADNDAEPSAKALVDRIAPDIIFPIRYIHAPESNISLARNACLDHCDTQWLAFIDDDEEVSRDWLSELLVTGIKQRADIVIGPVKACYLPNQPGWMLAGDFHSTYPVIRGGKPETGYTCNVLMSMSTPEIAASRFDLAYGASGGEDTLFFSKLVSRGMRIAFAPGAIVTEKVVTGRDRLRWLVNRRFRSGQTHGDLLLLEGRHILDRIRNATIAIGKATYCFAGVVLNAWSPVGWRRWLLRGSLHVGVVSRLMGQSLLIQYGNLRRGQANV